MDEELKSNEKWCHCTLFFTSLDKIEELLLFRWQYFTFRWYHRKIPLSKADVHTKLLECIASYFIWDKRKCFKKLAPPIQPGKSLPKKLCDRAIAVLFGPFQKIRCGLIQKNKSHQNSFMFIFLCLDVFNWLLW